MPRFIDIHREMPEMPAEMVQQMQDRISSGARDEFDAIAIDVLAGNDGSAFCITDAPDAASVVSSHTSKGVPMTEHDVHQVVSMGGK
ncbi:MAG: hypothetical protein O3B95_10835 [Chloroflexi bacterium]|nr:hypothetical protein [Chloroflexota bacterium]